MGQKVMFEVTQPVVSGNEVLHHSGDLYASLGEVPDGVQVRPVMVSAPDPRPKPKEPAPEPEPEPAAKAPAKTPAK
jgi:hypothetical protein